MSPSKEASPLLDDSKTSSTDKADSSSNATAAHKKEHQGDHDDDEATWTSSMADSLSPDHPPFLLGSNTNKKGLQSETSQAPSLKNYLQQQQQQEEAVISADPVVAAAGDVEDDGSWLIEAEEDEEPEDREETAAALLGHQLHHARMPSTIAEESHPEADEDPSGSHSTIPIDQTRTETIKPAHYDTTTDAANHVDDADSCSPRTSPPQPPLQEQELNLQDNTSSPTSPLNASSPFLAPSISITRSFLPRQAASLSDLTAATPGGGRPLPAVRPSSLPTANETAQAGSYSFSAHTQQKLQLPKDLSSDQPAMVLTMKKSSVTTSTPIPLSAATATPTIATTLAFEPHYGVTKLLQGISHRCFQPHYTEPLAAATWIGFWSLLHVTCANYVLTPMRDAIALAVGVSYIPKLTLASTLLAFCSSVPIGWLFEAPDPQRRRLWKRMGLTRGETQGTSLALFYRCFALILISYAIGFPLMDWLISHSEQDDGDIIKNLLVVEPLVSPPGTSDDETTTAMLMSLLANAVAWLHSYIPDVSTLLSMIGQGLYIAFFLVVHLMKLHSLSLVWGVTTEAMEYEDVARQKKNAAAKTNTGNIMADSASPPKTTAPTRLQRLALIGFGGTLGGILGSILASALAQVLYLPGLLVLAALLLEISAELSIELGRIMQKHWEEQQLFQSTNDLGSLVDASMRRSVSLGSMKRVASGNSLHRVRSATDLKNSGGSSTPTSPMASPHSTGSSNASTGSTEESNNNSVNDDTFVQRLLRGARTILNSRLLMAIFTYNALYASTTVLLSFQRAALVANRNETTSKEADMAFLANINMASSMAIFALQASGAGAFCAQACGPQGTLALMPLIRLAGVMALAWWHHTSQGQPPNLMVFLVVDECCKIMNLAVAKPVRESLWRGLSNEARYEAKPIVDTLANRWGGGSAAFLVSTLNKTLDLFGVAAAADGSRMVFGFPPILFLCLIIAAWWSVVSADLGQIRKRIDLELKKRQ